MPGDFELEKNAELNHFTMNAKSSVEIKNTTRGLTWNIKVVTGEEKLIDGLMKAAVKTHKDIEIELNKKGGNK